MNHKKSFIKYWFAWNGWSNVRGRNAKCCSHCSHYRGVPYCNLHDIQTEEDLLCDKFDWKKEYKSIYDD